jgi:SPX domain protein involved in polyphosphate accumulation
LTSTTQTVSAHTVQDFARYEFKYLLNQKQRDEIENEVRHFMTFDGYVDPDMDNCYFVRSLYFDNPGSTHYYEKIDGVMSRRKFRIRTYGRQPDERLPIFLEEKGRHNERTYKNRVAIDPGQLHLFLDQSRHREVLEAYKDVPLVNSFVFDCLRRRVEPVVLVDYQRRPYTSSFDMNFRLTFDAQLTALANNSLFPADTTGLQQSVAGWTILEVKFHRRIPAWFHRILQAHEMRRLSISKFCKGMEACGLARDLS